MLKPPMTFESYKKFISSWFFFSITTAISILSLLKSFNALQVNSWLAGFIDLYVRFASILYHLNDIFNIKITKAESLIAISWSLIFIPAFIAIYKHLTSREHKIYFSFGIIIFIIFIITNIDGEDAYHTWKNEGIFANLIAVFLIACITILFSVRERDYRIDAILYFSKHLIGASIICGLLILSGLADLVS